MGERIFDIYLFLIDIFIYSLFFYIINLDLFTYILSYLKYMHTPNLSMNL